MIIGGTPYGTVPLGGMHPTGVPFSGYTLQIGPVNATELLRVYTYRLTQDLNSRDELSFTLLSQTGYVPLVGQQVILSIDGGLQFVGSVQERDVEFLSEGDSIYTVVQVRCVDLKALADRRLVVEVYENQTAGQVVRQIVQKYLASELVQIGNVEDGPIVGRLVFPYQSVAQCLDELSERTGFHWNIDTQRTLSFAARVSAPAPFTITSANAVFRAVRGSRTRNQYRNVQYIDGGHGVTDRQVESFRGDGSVQSFNVQFPVFEVPTILLNDATQSVGIRGVDQGFQWYWNKNETSIGHDSLQPVLGTTDRLLVMYRGLYDLVSVVEDTGAVLERKTVEGGSGRYEQLERQDQLDGLDNVQQKALSLLRRYSSLDETIEFETDVPGLALGHLLTVDVPELGLTGAYLITHLETVSLLPETRRFTVGATTGDVKGRWQDFFSQLLSRSGPVTIREGEILQEVLAVHDPVGVTDSVTAVLADAGTGEWGPGDVGTAEFGG